MREIICRAGRAKASCRPTRRSESYAHPHLRTQHATTDDLQSPNIVAASIEVEHRALVRGARAVGYAMAATPSGRGIPWHRVIGAGGRIRVPEPYASKQRKMLETEGVVLDGGVIDMKIYGWAPAKRKSIRPRRKKKGLRSR